MVSFSGKVRFWSLCLMANAVAFAEPGPKAADVSSFLLHPIPHFTGSEAFFESLESNEAARQNINKLVEDSGGLSSTAKKGLKFKDALISEMKKDFPEGQKGLTQDLAFDPLGTIRKSLDSYRQMNQQPMDMPLRPEQVNARALLDTINTYGLPEGTSESDLKPGTMEAQHYQKRRWRFGEETERRSSRGDDAEVLNRWKKMITSELEDTRAANLKELARVVAKTTGGLQFGDSPNISETDFEDLEFEVLGDTKVASSKGDVRPSSLLKRGVNWTSRAVRESFSMGDRMVHRIFGYPQFKEAMKSRLAKTELGEESSSPVRITRKGADGTQEMLFEGSAKDLVEGLEGKYSQRKQSVNIKRAVGKIDLIDRVVEEAVNREKTLAVIEQDINKNRSEKTDYFIARFKKLEAREGLLSPTQTALAREKDSKKVADAISNVEWYGHGLMDGHWQSRDSAAKSKLSFDPVEGPSKHAPMRLIRRGFKAVPGILRAGVLWSAMSSGMGLGTAAAVYYTNPDFLKAPPLPFDISQWMPERDVKETPPVIDLDAKNGAKAKSTVLFNVHPLHDKNLKDLPIFFHYATTEQLKEARGNDIAHSGLDIPEKSEKGDLKVTSNIPMKATEEGGEITIPTPKDGVLTALVVRDGNGKEIRAIETEQDGKIIKKRPYSIRQDKASGVYFAKLLRMPVDVEEAKAATFKIEATFEQPKEKDENGKEIEKKEGKELEEAGVGNMMGGGFMSDATKMDKDDRVLKIPAEKVTPELEHLKKAGLTEIAKEIEKKISEKKEAKKTLMVQEIGLAVMQKSVQSEERGTPSDKPIDPNDPYAEFKQYVKEGKLHTDPNTGNRLLERVLKRIFADQPDIKVARLPVIIREPEKGELNIRNFFVRNVVSVDDGKKKWMLDGVPGTPAEKKKPKEPGKPIVDLDLPRRRSPIETGKEPPKRLITPEEHAKRMSELENHIREITDVLIDDPAKRRDPREGKNAPPKKSPPKIPGHIASQLKSAKAVAVGRAVGSYASGETSVEDLYRALHKILPDVVPDPDVEMKKTDVDYEATELEKSHENDIGNTASKMGKHLGDEIRRIGDFVLKNRTKGPMAIHAAPEYQKAVSNLLDFVAGTDWTPVTKPSNTQAADAKLCAGFKKIAGR